MDSKPLDESEDMLEQEGVVTHEVLIIGNDENLNRNSNFEAMGSWAGQNDHANMHEWDHFVRSAGGCQEFVVLSAVWGSSSISVTQHACQVVSVLRWALVRV